MLKHTPKERYIVVEGPYWSDNGLTGLHIYRGLANRSDADRLAEFVRESNMGIIYSQGGYPGDVHIIDINDSANEEDGNVQLAYYERIEAEDEGLANEV